LCRGCGRSAGAAAGGLAAAAAGRGRPVATVTVTPLDSYRPAWSAMTSARARSLARSPLCRVVMMTSMCQSAGRACRRSRLSADVLAAAVAAAAASPSWSTMLSACDSTPLQLIAFHSRVVSKLFTGAL